MIPRKKQPVKIGQAEGIHIGPSNFLLKKDLHIYFDGLEFIIKKGYPTDGASIPFFLEPIGGNRFSGDVLSPAIFHDMMYESETYSRHCADNNFLFLMRKNGVGWWKRSIFWLMVRIFGWLSQLRHTVGSVENARQYLQIKKKML